MCRHCRRELPAPPPSQIPYQERYARDYGVLDSEVSSRDYGAGCGDLSLLSGPAHAKKDFMRTFGEKGHMVSASIAGIRRA